MGLVMQGKGRVRERREGEGKGSKVLRVTFCLSGLYVDASFEVSGVVSKGC